MIALASWRGGENLRSSETGPRHRVECDSEGQCEMANALRLLLRFPRARSGTFHAADQRPASRLSTALVIALIACFAVTLPLTLPSIALAETVQDPVRTAAHSDRLSVPEVQGLGCITAGAAGAIGAYVYSDMMVMAVATSARR